jgi:hypothetical protein
MILKKIIDTARQNPANRGEVCNPRTTRKRVLPESSLRGAYKFFLHYHSASHD